MAAGVEKRSDKMSAGERQDEDDMSWAPFHDELAISLATTGMRLIQDLVALKCWNLAQHHSDTHLTQISGIREVTAIIAGRSVCQIVNHP